MARNIPLSGMVALTLAGLAGCNDAPPESRATPVPAPDIVITGLIYTGSATLPVADYITVTAGAISAVGEGRPAVPGLDDGSYEGRLIELDRAVAYPGLTDAHAHLIGIGLREMTLNLEGTASVAELQSRLAAEIETTAPGAVVYGRGWIETGWPEGRFPTRDDLDAVAPDNPVLLGRADGHAAVANSAALTAAGIGPDTPDPQGGRIERDADGRATGMLIDAAMAPAYGLIESPGEAQRREALRRGAEVYASLGWTGLHNMSVDPADAQLIAGLEEAGELPIRVYNFLTPEGLDELVETGIWEMNDGKVTTRGVKFYIDGALGSRGAALKQPYADRPETAGLLLMEEEEAKAAYARALDNSIQVATHAIGDRGNTLVLDWYGQVIPPVRHSYEEGPRWRIEHAQILDPADYPRFAGLGVVASMQPSHAIGDLHFAEDRLGTDRLNGAYAWRSLADADAVIAGGSDAPVERGDPMIEYYAAVARRDLEGYRGENWHGEEMISRSEALDLFTVNPAWASFNEDRLGTLEVGKKADISILSGDIMTLPKADIPAVRAVMTIVDGKIVYETAD